MLMHPQNPSFRPYWAPKVFSFRPHSINLCRPYHLRKHKIVMKKLLLVLFFAPLFAIAQAPKGFTIEGKLDGFPDGTKVSLYRNGVQTEWQATTIQKGKFSFKEKVEEPTLCFITIEGAPNAVEVYVENAVISVKGNKAQPGKYDIEGSKSHKDFADFVAA